MLVCTNNKGELINPQGQRISIHVTDDGQCQIVVL